MKQNAVLLLFMLIFTACNPEGSVEESKNNTSSLSQKEMMYWSNGKKLYETFCSNCHTEEGIGMGRLIPPLKNSNYLMADLARSARILKFGQKGEVTVNGVVFNQPMPANPKLTYLEIAEIITYISNNWGNEAGGFTIENARSALNEGTN